MGIIDFPAVSQDTVFSAADVELCITIVPTPECTGRVRSSDVMYRGAFFTTFRYSPNFLLNVQRYVYVVYGSKMSCCFTLGLKVRKNHTLKIIHTEHRMWLVPSSKCVTKTKCEMANTVTYRGTAFFVIFSREHISHNFKDYSHFYYLL